MRRRRRRHDFQRILNAVIFRANSQQIRSPNKFAANSPNSNSIRCESASLPDTTQRVAYDRRSLTSSRRGQTPVLVGLRNCPVSRKSQNTTNPLRAGSLGRAPNRTQFPNSKTKTLFKAIEVLYTNSFTATGISMLHMYSQIALQSRVCALTALLLLKIIPLPPP